MLEHGDINKYIIGDSTLIKGDCLEVMDQLIENQVVVDSIITDLPYGKTTCSWDSIIPLDQMWEKIDKLIKPQGAICLFGCEPFSSTLRLSNLKMYKYDWIWHKSSCSNFIAAPYQPRRTYEIVSVFSKGAASYTKRTERIMQYYPQMGEDVRAVHKVYEDRESRKAYSRKSKEGYKLVHKNLGKKYPESIIYFSADKDKIHPTQKPVELMKYLVQTYSNEGETVLDFTAGSFSTGVACVLLNRKFIGIELDEEYFNNGLKRIKETNDVRNREN